MLSRDLLRNEPDRVRTALANRGQDGALVDRFLALDGERRALLVVQEDRKRQRNEASREIGRLKASGGDAAAAIGAVAWLKGEIEAAEARLAALDEELAAVELSLPNLPHESLPVGPDASANRVEAVVGEPPRFAFPPQAHWDLGPALGILDFERGAKVAGARFTTYFGPGAQLERALVNFMLDLHTREHGYTEVLPPFVVNRDSLVGTGQLPKFEQDLFHLDGFPYYLVPTAEVPVTNLHRDEVLEAGALPVRYCAYTPCFRSEAGSHGRDVRGLIRQHQFNKVELVKFSVPETSYDELEKLTLDAEDILKTLGLHFRTVSLCTADLGFSSAKTYDLEVWLPGQNVYREISSCSNFGDFQARRASIRFRREGSGKVEFVHTLNGSGLAVGRTVVAILENYQQKDGSVVIPEPLRPYMKGIDRIPAGG